MVTCNTETQTPLLFLHSLKYNGEADVHYRATASSSISVAVFVWHVMYVNYGNSSSSPASALIPRRTARQRLYIVESVIPQTVSHALLLVIIVYYARLLLTELLSTHSLQKLFGTYNYTIIDNKEIHQTQKPWLSHSGIALLRDLLFMKVYSY